MDELGYAMNAEFTVDLRSVSLRRTRRELQRRRNLHRRLTLRDELRDLNLAIGEFLVKRMQPGYVFSFTNGTT